MIQLQTLTAGEHPVYTQEVSLEGVIYLIKLVWTQRIDRWVASIYTQGGTAIVEGAVVNNMINLLRGSTVTGKPPGRLVALALDGVNTHAGLTDLGTRVGLCYYSEAEVLAASG